ncbi:hypothetical protein [Streptomyces sp. NRRL WC-3725]|nr:hypothetical protein [Streptomyces sp. NRRL WC-3725]
MRAAVVEGDLVAAAAQASGQEVRQDNCRAGQLKEVRFTDIEHLEFDL